MTRSIWLYVCFKLGNSTIRYICDTQHLIIFCIILYSEIFPFLINISITTYMLLFWSAYTVLLDPPVVYYLIFTIHLSLLQPINCNYSRLSFYYITYSTNNTSSISSSWCTDTKVSAIHWYSSYWYFVYCIKNTFRTKKGDCF